MFFYGSGHDLYCIILCDRLVLFMKAEFHIMSIRRKMLDIVSMGDNYLDWIQKYREDGYRTYYQDETWVFKNMTCGKVWRGIVGSSTDQVFNVSNERGDRSIFSHIGSTETGLLQNCLLIFRELNQMRCQSITLKCIGMFSVIDAVPRFSHRLHRRSKNQWSYLIECHIILY